MLSAAIRNGARRQASIASRSFTTTTNKLAAAEVSKLGVIGAGQMVSV
jgi:3-hydroxybutyryl-CoA dehydrogenase